MYPYVYNRRFYGLFRAMLYAPFVFFAVGGYGQVGTVDFRADVVEGCAPLRVNFTDNSSGVIQAWEWDFGKTSNNSSQQQNPTTLYTLPGTYTVTLTATFAGGASTRIQKTAYIRVYASPSINFSSDIGGGCLPSVRVQFKNNSSPGEGSITKWEWIFGDGGTSDEENPIHTYTTAGDKVVALRAENSVGCSGLGAIASPIVISAINLAFSATPSCTTPTEISFANASTGGNGNEMFKWDFGDGNASTEAAPQHAYTQAGQYTVSLSVEGALNCTTTRILQAGAPPSPDFTVDSSSPRCVGVPMTFKIFTPGLTRMEWDWGDGQRQLSTASTIRKSYAAAGAYTVTLTATYASGCTGSRAIQVVVANLPQPDFTVNGCGPERAFLALAIPGKTIASREWVFGDGRVSTLPNPTHRYATKKNFDVTLKVQDAFGCQGEITKRVPVFDQPSASFLPNRILTCAAEVNVPGASSLGGCAPHTVTFTNTGRGGIPNEPETFRWDFDDGQASDEENPTHTFTNPGEYNVTFTISNSLGCQDQIIRVVKVSSPPSIPSFTMDKTRACVGEKVRLTASQSNADNWCWAFSDGGSAVGRTIEHRFKEIEDADVILTASRDGCVRSITATDTISIVGVEPDFEVKHNCTDPYRINIESTPEGLNTNTDTWTWDFGDAKANADSSLNPVHKYDTTGQYRVVFTVNHQATGCIIEGQQDIEIVDVKADFTADPKSGCGNASVRFESASQFANLLRWDFGINGTSVAGTARSLSVFSMTYPKPGKFTVKLTATDIHNCQSVSEKRDFISVLDMQARFSNTVLNSDCDTLKVRFDDASTGQPPITGWKWDFGDNTAVSNAQNPLHSYTKLGTYDVTLTLVNSEGECSAKRSSLVRFTNPVPEFRVPKKAYCVDEAFSLVNQSRNALTYSWDIDDQGAAFRSINPRIIYSNTGLYDVTLKATDRFGCSKEKTVQQAIQVVDVDVDFTADNTMSECPPLFSSFRVIPSQGSDSIRRWNWSFGDGGVSDLSQPTYIYTIPGSYTVSLDVESRYGCRDRIEKTDFIYLDGPYGSVSVQDIACLGDPVSLEGTANNTVRHIWDFGDGNTSPDLITTHIYNEAKSYAPILQLEDQDGCTVLIQTPHEVVIRPLPEVDFSFVEPYPFPEENLFFTAVGGEEIKQWKWTFNNSIDYAGPEASYTFPASGVWPVYLQGVDAHGCIGRQEKGIVVQEPLQFIPNVFTPNGDEKNRTFTLLNVRKGIWDLTVYNRHGKRVYSMKGYDNSWDGGDLAPGVYYYRLKNRYRDRSYKGYVQILR